MNSNGHSRESEQLVKKINTRNALVGIIGLGYVGLPLALHFGRQGFKVIGFDLDRGKVEAINNGRSYIRHLGSEAVGEMVDCKKLEATDDFSHLAETDCILICVPTPLDDNLDPDLSFLLNTTDTVARYLRRGQLIVLESTTYPGTTEEMMLPPLSAAGMEVGKDFFLAFSPEREDPGNKNFSAHNTPKVVGGVTASCLNVADTLYSKITTTVPVSSTRTAEMTKLLENTFRSVNIALVNELKILCHKMGIDIFEVIEAAATKPFGYTPFYPGPGLGGHCIPIDPFYLAWKAKEYDFTARFIHLAGEVNISMPDYVVDKTIEALAARGKKIDESYILILGIAYKKDIDDDRESPGYAIMQLLTDKGAGITYNDPWIPAIKPTRKYDFSMQSTPLTTATLKSADAVVVVTDHSDYNFTEIVAQAQLVIDTRNVTAMIKDDRTNIVLA